MPDLVLAEDSKQYKDLAYDFAKNEIAPHAHKFDQSGEFPLTIFQKAWEIGLVNVMMPESAGGLGLGLGDACVMAEELGAACAGVGTALWANDLSVARLLQAKPEQQKQWLAPLSSQFGLAAYCLRYPSQAAAVTAKQNGNQFELNGSAVVINGRHAQWATLAAINTADNTSCVFIVPSEKLPPATPLPTVGLKCADVCQLEFQSVQLPSENVIGTIGGGGQLLEKTEARSYPILAAYAVGIMRACLEHSSRYAQERHTMGVPIAKHQAVAFMLADMAKDAEAARFMVRKAAWLSDSGHADLTASKMAKNFACQSAIKAATDAVQVFGGYGYSREYPVEKLMRDAKTLQVLEQSPITDNIAIARQLVAAAQ